MARPDGVPALVLRRHERTVMGVENARMAGRCPVQLEHERGRRHDGMDGVSSGSTFGWADPGGFVPLTGLGRRSTPSSRGSACRALRLRRLDDNPATPASDQISTPRDRQPALLDQGPEGVDNQLRVPVRLLPRRLRRQPLDLSGLPSDYSSLGVRQRQGASVFAGDARGPAAMRNGARPALRRRWEAHGSVRRDRRPSLDAAGSENTLRASWMRPAFGRTSQ